MRQRRMAMPLRWKTSGLLGSRRAHAATNRQSAANRALMGVNRPFIGCEGARQRFTHVADSLRLLGKQPLAPTLFRRFANLGRFVAPYAIRRLERRRQTNRSLRLPCARTPRSYRSCRRSGVGGNCKFPICGNRKLHTLVVGGCCPAFHAVDDVTSEGARGRS